MRKKGAKGAPKASDFAAAKRTAKKATGGPLGKVVKGIKKTMGGAMKKRVMKRGGGMMKPKMMGGGMMKKRMKRGGRAK